MKKMSILLAAAAVIAVNAGELLVNTDLSKGMDKFIVYQEKKGKRVNPEIVTEDGAKAIQFAKPAAGYANVYQKVDLKPGKYVASYEVKADPVEARVSYAYVYGNDVNKDGKRSGKNFLYMDDGLRKKGNTSWHKVTKQFTVPATGKTSLIHFVVRPQYEGTVLFRNFSIKAVK